ncbi:uncharacterized protein LOC100839204 [Brachypodium distachyon]|uniref:DUF1618 domain-containing protein n=1 Tax=Brachypodium distachyon TaxID=15368 RepID=I1HM53_BRADI|nr:uncharacterized protein LOC100839204 [Brachypodium distachyon]KQK07658.1 hypothetical protein BRADI_2g36840v3 [Brachypodium distachyon]|eukprot:XP_003568978.1 uncharacterized protein LOC100839204 [Brachypodium distachyon]
MAVSSWVPPSLPESGASGLVLLDKCCYIADLRNDTTAESTTSGGLPLKVTFRAARPPLVSHFCVYCPGLDFRSKGPPKIVATDADLVLLSVPAVDPNSSSRFDRDYFVYSTRAPWLHLLPNPHPRRLHHSSTALISRQAGASYAVAALGICSSLYDGDTLLRWEFDLHLYRSSDSKGWISKRLSVNGLERDKLIPLPRGVDRLYHETGKTITVGGDHGTVAWVDLWRGIFFCDVLKKRPRLRDVPLPAPARRNWERLLRNSDPGYLRDVTISRNKDSIKYVELEFLESIKELDATVPDSYADWVRNRSRKSQVIVRDGWKSTTWNMAIPAGSSSWRRDCVLDVKDVGLEEAGDPCLSHLMAMLSGKTIKELPVGYPILSMDDDVVYLRSETRVPRHMEKLALMFSIDVRKAELRGWAELDAKKSSNFLPAFCTSEICRGT